MWKKICEFVISARRWRAIKYASRNIKNKLEFYFWNYSKWQNIYPNKSLRGKAIIRRNHIVVNGSSGKNHQFPYREKSHFGRRRGVCAGALSLRRRSSTERPRRQSPSDKRARRPPLTAAHPEINSIFTLLFYRRYRFGRHSARMIDIIQHLNECSISNYRRLRIGVIYLWDISEVRDWR